MGLIGAILHSLYVGVPCVLLSPTTFVQNPYLWLKAITDYRGTAAGAPNFGYELCVSKITIEQAASLDLSSWKVAWTGAEQIRAETIISFENRFSYQGFNKTAFAPVYGLAECTLAVTIGHCMNRFKSIDISKVRGFKGQVISPAIDHSTKTNVLVSCGSSLPDQVIRIVSPLNNKPLPELNVGEIYVKGPSVAEGYWNNSLATEEHFNQPIEQEKGFFRTGDLGFQYRGELYILGRVKETMKINGRNIFPSDIESTVVRAHDGIKPNGTAAFYTLHRLMRRHLRHHRFRPSSHPRCHTQPFFILVV
jgi:acyl-CoA synthetase (AMP-forming)/AMP-acid ligase II